MRYSHGLNPACFFEISGSTSFAYIALGGANRPWPAPAAPLSKNRRCSRLRTLERGFPSGNALGDLHFPNLPQGSSTPSRSSSSAPGGPLEDEPQVHTDSRAVDEHSCNVRTQQRPPPGWSPLRRAASSAGCAIRGARVRRRLDHLGNTRWLDASPYTVRLASRTMAEVAHATRIHARWSFPAGRANTNGDIARQSPPTIPAHSFALGLGLDRELLR